jgi:multidrug transporter EmrE-like cation transporter
MWTAAGWAETTYIILASLAYVVWGLGMVSSGFPSAWAGWASIAIGGLSVVGVMIAPERLGFPQLPVLVPIVVGVALVIA